MKFTTVHSGDIGSNRKLIFEIGLQWKLKPEIGIWIDSPRFLVIYNRSPFEHYPITCQSRKIKLSVNYNCILYTVGPTIPARIVKGDFFRSMSVRIR